MNNYNKFYLLKQQIYFHPGREELKEIFNIAASKNNNLISFDDFKTICDTICSVLNIGDINVQEFFDDLYPNSSTPGFIPITIIISKLFEYLLYIIREPGKDAINISNISEDEWNRYAEILKTYIKENGGFRKFQIEIDVISDKGDSNIDLPQFLKVFDNVKDLSQQDLVAIFLKIDIHNNHYISCDKLMEFIQYIYYNIQ